MGLVRATCENWADCVQVYKANDAFQSSFDNCKALLLKAAANPTISIQKPCCENENKIVNIYGERLQTERRPKSEASKSLPCAESGAMDDLMKGARGLGEGEGQQREHLYSHIM